MLTTTRALLVIAALAAPLSSSARAQSAPNPFTVRASGPASDHTPVVFVHGVGADAFNLWFVATDYLKAQGYTAGDITVFQYAALEGAAPGAEQLASEVAWLLAKTGKSKVDIVSHSFGSLVTKLCIVEAGCKGKVAHWASLAGANNGSNIDLGVVKPSTVDAAPTSPLIARLQAADDAEIAAQGVKVQVQWTPTDKSILPPVLSLEVYAENVELPASVTHQSILFDRDVIARFTAFFGR